MNNFDGVLANLDGVRTKYDARDEPTDDFTGVHLIIMAVFEHTCHLRGGQVCHANVRTNRITVSRLLAVCDVLRCLNETVQNNNRSFDELIVRN